MPKKEQIREAFEKKVEVEVENTYNRNLCFDPEYSLQTAAGGFLRILTVNTECLTQGHRARV